MTDTETLKKTDTPKVIGFLESLIKRIEDQEKEIEAAKKIEAKKKS